MNILEIINLSKTYGKGENKVEAIKNINLSIEKGKFIAIIGASGSVKSTLLHCIAGLDNITSGEVIFEGQNISKLSEEELSRLRSRKFGFIFQSFNLIPVINVYDNIVLPINIDNKRVDKEYINSIIKVLGLSDKIKKFPNELSGGQQQRVAIIFADEPTGNLDSSTTDEVINLLKECSLRFGQTLVMITHNNEIANMADKIVTIQDGSILN